MSDSRPFVIGSRPATAITMMADSVAYGRGQSSGVRNRRVITATTLANALDSPVTAPAWKFTADRKNEPQTV